MAKHHLPQIRTKILHWYARNARDLPWRKTRDPYKIWVSEIMLQQTQVKTVIPYYLKWIQAFPTLKDLAKAKSQTVMKFWAGLGYYRRARMLHEGAKEIIKQWEGKLPSKPELLMKIPGIGRYTAGAIASIAFEKKAPVLDGNVIRVLTRLHALGLPMDSLKIQKRLWKLAEELLPETQTGDFNQALMEIGATLCTPFNPMCSQCPLQMFCKAHAKKKEEAYPVKKNRLSILKKNTFATLIKKNNTWLVKKQTGREPWSGLWIFPTWGDLAAMKKELNEMGISNTPIPRTSLYHSFTRYQIHLKVYDCPVAQTTFFRISSKMKWVSKNELKQLALPSPYRKIADSIINNKNLSEQKPKEG